MKHTLVAMLGVATLAASASALAGPDWTVIERARAQKRAQQQALAQQQKPCELKAADTSASTASRVR
jgi:hypothetical protein